jgi:hypothetical protein
MVAAAVIDRLVHRATMITLKGKSYRPRERASSDNRASRRDRRLSLIYRGGEPRWLCRSHTTEAPFDPC